MQVLLSTAYLPPIQWFARLANRSEVYIDPWESYHKQTYRNRCVIDSPNGPVVLTVPVEKPENGSRLMKDMLISDHDDWRNKHWHALRSSYDNTPFFEFYEDDLEPLYRQPFRSLMEFNEVLIRKCVELIGIQCEIRHTDAFADPDDIDPGQTDDLRFLISPKVDYTEDAAFKPVPYYQVFAQKTGFKPNLSIVDLLFNMGPESIFILKTCL